MSVSNEQIDSSLSRGDNLPQIVKSENLLRTLQLAFFESFFGYYKNPVVDSGPHFFRVKIMVTQLHFFLIFCNEELNSKR